SVHRAAYSACSWHSPCCFHGGRSCCYSRRSPCQHGYLPWDMRCWNSHWASPERRRGSPTLLISAACSAPIFTLWHRGDGGSSGRRLIAVIKFRPPKAVGMKQVVLSASGLISVMRELARFVR